VVLLIEACMISVATELCNIVRVRDCQLYVLLSACEYMTLLIITWYRRLPLARQS